MDFLKSILQSLPLEKISDILGEIVIWWSQMVKGVPPADLPMYAYLGGAIVVLLLWILVARMMPRPLGGISWMVLFAVLLAPGTALGDPSIIAPASISVVYAIMMKDTTAAVNNALPVLIVLVVGLFIGFVWQLIRGAFEASLDKARLRSAEDTTANMQLASGNYLAGSPLGERVHEPLSADALINNPKISGVPIESAAITPRRLNEIQKNTSLKGINKPDIDIKKDSTVNRKKVEGFYSKKVIEEPVAKINDVKDNIIENSDITNKK